VSAPSLHPNQLRILAALKSATQALKLTEHLLVVGSLGPYLAGNVKESKDVDVLIDADLCNRYWDLVSQLAREGIVPVYDLLDRPEGVPWNNCLSEVAHGLSLTIDRCASPNRDKGTNLDICVNAADLRHIPNSGQWVRWPFKQGAVSKLCPAQREKRITEGHQDLLDHLRDEEQESRGRSASWLSLAEVERRLGRSFEEPPFQGAPCPA
jgi:hypothetical protein